MSEGIVESNESVAGNADHSDAQHPIGVYLKVWILLFVLSTFSYMVDYFDFQGILRWTLILVFMFSKAGFIIAIFIHVMWERITLITTILGPPAVILLLIGMMASEGDYVFCTRVDYLGQPAAAERIHVADVHLEEEAEH